MARAGSFGGATNPYGSGRGGTFSAYDIGDNVQDLARYKAEVAWGNGQLSDDAYLAVLRNVVAHTTPGSQAQITAQNALDDALYSIGRSRAAAQGNDALIAFDQAALLRMTPDNNKYRSVKNSLDAELAQRRSEQYSKLVDQYNDGRLATAVLMTWVQNTLQTLSPDAPDYNNWQSTLDSLRKQAQSEKDTATAQDYQMGRITSAQWLAYLKSRRDQYDPTSPDYATWNNRLESDSKSIADAAQSAKDQAFFDAYNEGKKSDADYLKYIRDRLAGMAPDDPNREEWQHRYNTASYSIAEDQLIFAVNHKQRPVSDLVAFYKAYQRTLNPGSAEWRTTQDKIDSLKGATGGGASATGNGAVAPGNTGKIISPKFTLEMAFTELTLPTNANKTLLANFNLNYASLQNAYQRGDPTWEFFDPAHPGQTVMLPTSGSALARLDGIKATYNKHLAEKAFADGNTKDAYKYIQNMIEARDHARGVDITTARRALNAELDGLSTAIKQAGALGDDASVFNLTRKALTLIDGALSDPTLDDNARAALTARGDKLADNPLWPIDDPLHPGVKISRALDVANSQVDADGNIVQAQLAPGWHRVFDVSPTTGEQSLRLVLDTGQTGQWAQDHITVHINVGDRVVSADAKRQPDQIGIPILAVDSTGKYHFLPSDALPIQTIVYFDGKGNRVQAYSIDGVTWVSSNAGQIPQLQLNGVLTDTDNGDGTHTFTDASGAEVGTVSADGRWSWSWPPGPGAISWIGEPGQITDSMGSVGVSSTPDPHLSWSRVGADGSLVRFTNDWQAPVAPLGEKAYQYSSGSPKVAAADTRTPARLSPQAYQYSSGSRAVAAADTRSWAPIPKNAYVYSSASTAIPSALQTLTAQGRYLLNQLSPSTGPFRPGTGLSPAPAYPYTGASGPEFARILAANKAAAAAAAKAALAAASAPLPKNAYQYSSGSANVAAAAKAAADKAAADAAAKLAAEHAGYEYSSGSPAVAAAAPKPKATKPGSGGGPGPKAL